MPQGHVNAAEASADGSGNGAFESHFVLRIESITAAEGVSPPAP